MKAFKAFIKPSEAPQRSAKIKILFDFFSFRPELGREGLRHYNTFIIMKFEQLALILSRGKCESPGYYYYS